MSLRANASRLTAVTRDLSNQWQETRQYWRDTKSEEFQKKYLEELFATVERTVAIMEELDKLLLKIRTDCE
jgi:hypothetical protein